LSDVPAASHLSKLALALAFLVLASTNSIGRGSQGSIKGLLNSWITKSIFLRSTAVLRFRGLINDRVDLHARIVLLVAFISAILPFFISDALVTLLLLFPRQPHQLASWEACLNCLAIVILDKKTFNDLGCTVGNSVVIRLKKVSLKFLDKLSWSMAYIVSCNLQLLHHA
jgi:hypothetical protein